MPNWCLNETMDSNPDWAPQLLAGISASLSFAAWLAALKWARRLNTVLVSRYFLSPFSVLGFYLLPFLAFLILPELCNRLTVAAGALFLPSLPAVSGSPAAWQRFGILQWLLGAYLSYRNFLKQAP